MENVSVTFRPPEELLQSIAAFRRDDESIPVCDECVQQSDDLKRCTQCKEVWYCGKKCQSQAWKNGHKVWCGKIAVRDIPGKGKGVIAMKNITMGEVVITEKPLMLFKAGNGLSECLSKMSDIGKRRLMSLYDRDNENERTVLGILLTNCLAGRMATSVLYYLISRLNHSCVPNVLIDQQFPTSVIAIRNIPEGAEIVWCYNGDALYQDKHTRNRELEQGWSIANCRCLCCTLPDDQQKVSDETRILLKDVERKLVNAAKEDTKLIPELAAQKHQLMFNEGLTTADNLAYLARDMLHSPLTEKGFEKYRNDGLELAKLLKDEALIKYFEQFNQAVGCRGCFRCKPHKFN